MCRVASIVILSLLAAWWVLSYINWATGFGSTGALAIHILVPGLIATLLILLFQLGTRRS